MTTIGGPFPGDWMWHGGVLSEIDGNIYAIPCNANGVLKINPRTDKVEIIGGPWPNEPVRQKWYGGIVGHDGNIYGIPQCASGVLKINPRTQECTVIGIEEVSSHGVGEKMGWKWHGGFCDQNTNIIYGIASNADAILKIDTKTDTITTIGYPGLYRSLKGGSGNAVVEFKGMTFERSKAEIKKKNISSFSRASNMHLIGSILATSSKTKLISFQNLSQQL